MVLGVTRRWAVGASLVLLLGGCGSGSSEEASVPTAPTEMTIPDNIEPLLPYLFETKTPPLYLPSSLGGTLGLLAYGDSAPDMPRTAPYRVLDDGTVSALDTGGDLSCNGEGRVHYVLKTSPEGNPLNGTYELIKCQGGFLLFLGKLEFQFNNYNSPNDYSMKLSGDYAVSDENKSGRTTVRDFQLTLVRSVDTTSLNYSGTMLWDWPLASGVLNFATTTPFKIRTGEDHEYEGMLEFRGADGGLIRLEVIDTASMELSHRISANDQAVKRTLTADSFLALLQLPEPAID